MRIGYSWKWNSMRIWHFKLRIIRRYAAYLGHCMWLCILALLLWVSVFMWLGILALLLWVSVFMWLGILALLLFKLSCNSKMQYTMFVCSPFSTWYLYWTHTTGVQKASADTYRYWDTFWCFHKDVCDTRATTEYWSGRREWHAGRERRQSNGFTWKWIRTWCTLTLSRDYC